MNKRKKEGKRPHRPGEEGYPDKEQWDKVTKEEIEEIVSEEVEKVLEQQEEDPKKAAEQNIKDAQKIVTAAQQETRAEIAVSSVLPSNSPEQKASKKAGLQDARAKENLAKDNLNKAKETAQEVSAKPVTEQKSNFQKYVTKKGKSWKVRLLTKGKQSAGSAYPNKAPTDRAKSAPPVLQEAEEGKYGQWLKQIEKDAFIVINSLFKLDIDWGDHPAVENVLKQIKDKFSYVNENADEIRKNYQNLKNFTAFSQSSAETEKLLRSDREALTGLYYDEEVQKEISQLLAEFGVNHKEGKDLINFLNLGNPKPGQRREPVNDEYGEEDIAPPAPNKTVTDRAGKKTAPKPVTMGPEDDEIAARRARAQGDKTQP